MAFRFSMQKVLDYREQLEEEAKVRLAEAQRRRREAAERFESLSTTLHEAQNKAREAMLKDAAERWLYESYVKGLRSDVSASAMQVQMADKMVEEFRKLLTERAIEKKMLDKLKTRKKHMYMHEELLKEQHTNDETATLRYKAPTF